MQYSTNIRKKDKGYQYIITYKDNEGKWKTKSKQGFPSNKDGKILAQTEMDIMVDELKKVSEVVISPDMLGITFGKFTKQHLKHLSLHIEMNTKLAFDTVLNHFKSLDEIEIAKVSLSDIQDIVDDMTREGLSPNTIKDYMQKLNTFFRSAMDEHNLITSLPTKNIKLTKNKKQTDKRALTKEEADKLLEDFSNSKLKSKYYLIILIALKCGLRLGEILGLTWSKIDTKNAVIKVDQQWKQISEKEYNFGTLKSINSFREVPIPLKTTLPILKKYKDEATQVPALNKVILLKSKKDVVIIDKRVFKFKNTDSVSICLNRLLKKGGYNITVHELRHTYATTLIANRVDPKTAAQYLGHTVQQTLTTYCHVNNDMLKTATSIIDNIL